MSYYVINCITNSVKCCIRRLILLIIHVILYCVMEILKLILIMAAVYAIAQLLYIAWERYLEKHVLSEFRAINDMSKLKSIQSAQFRSAISQSAYCVHSISGQIKPQTDTPEPSIPLTTERDTQTSEELLPVKIVHTTEKVEFPETTTSKADTGSVKSLDFEADAESIKQVGFGTGTERLKISSLKVVEQRKRQTQTPESLSETVIDKDRSARATARGERKNKRSKRAASTDKKRDSSSEKETDDESVDVTRRRRRKKKHHALKFEPVKILYENTSSDEQVNELHLKGKQLLKQKPIQNDSLEDIELLNTPIRISNYLKKRDSSPSYARENAKDAKALRKKSSIKSVENLVQKDERQINKVAYARRSTLR